MTLFILRPPYISTQITSPLHFSTPSVSDQYKPRACIHLSQLPIYLDTDIDIDLLNPLSTDTKDDDPDKNKTRIVKDKFNESFSFYQDVPTILSALKGMENVKVAVASRTSAPKLAREMLNLLTIPNAITPTASFLEASSPAGPSSSSLSAETPRGGEPLENDGRNGLTSDSPPDNKWEGEDTDGQDKMGMDEGTDSVTSNEDGLGSKKKMGKGKENGAGSGRKAIEAFDYLEMYPGI